MQCLLLRFEAPMMSFGGISVDARRPTDRAPGASLLAGLLGNALGLEHRDHERLQRLQDRLCVGARCDRPGSRLQDYQTVDLGQPHLVGAGWTTQGRVEVRGGAFSTGTHIRHRDYLADASYLVALALEPPDEEPGIERLAEALDRPARPLYLGRKGCIPATRLLVGVVSAGSLEQALLASAPHTARGQSPGAEVELWLPAAEATLDGHTAWISDRRDWANQIHTGRRLQLHKTAQLRGGTGD
ncbi:MAG TPA: type I-E CRISPR-associated protein Cas5/CasD [Deltaproteobacteria bacterium]|nr:type I-E CRISPR-associated protein Cas5/CasD [Deltaproteobacteria bacterium]